MEMNETSSIPIYSSPYGQVECAKTSRRVLEDKRRMQQCHRNICCANYARLPHLSGPVDDGFSVANYTLSLQGWGLCPVERETVQS